MKQFVCEGCSHPCTIIVHEGAFKPRWCPYDETRGEMSLCKWVEVSYVVVHKTGRERAVSSVEGMTPEQRAYCKALAEAVTHMYERGYTVFGKSAYIEERLNRVKEMFKEDERCSW